MKFTVTWTSCSHQHQPLLPQQYRRNRDISKIRQHQHLCQKHQQLGNDATDRTSILTTGRSYQPTWTFQWWRSCGCGCTWGRQDSSRASQTPWTCPGWSRCTWDRQGSRSRSGSRFYRTRSASNTSSPTDRFASTSMRRKLCNMCKTQHQHIKAQQRQQHVRQLHLNLNKLKSHYKSNAQQLLHHKSRQPWQSLLRRQLSRASTLSRAKTRWLRWKVKYWIPQSL